MGEGGESLMSSAGHSGEGYAFLSKAEMVAFSCFLKTCSGVSHAAFALGVENILSKASRSSYSFSGRRFILCSPRFPLQGKEQDSICKAVPPLCHCLPRNEEEGQTVAWYTKRQDALHFFLHHFPEFSSFQDCGKQSSKVLLLYSLPA